MSIRFGYIAPSNNWASCVGKVPEIRDVDEGVIEGRKDTCNAEDKLACISCQLLTDGSSRGYAGTITEAGEIVL